MLSTASGPVNRRPSFAIKGERGGAWCIVRPMTTTAGILAEAQDVLDDTIRLRRRIHRHPELGLTLPRTQAVVLEALDGLGLEVRTGQRTTSVVATLTGTRPGPTIL